MDKIRAILRGILDHHTSRKNALSFGKGEPCVCDERIDKLGVQ